MRGSSREREAAVAAAPSGEGAAATLGACLEASGKAVLVCSEGGAVLAHNNELARLCQGWPPEAERATLAQLVSWLSRRHDEAPLAIARLLSAVDAQSEGEMRLSDGRTLEWRRVSLGAHAGEGAGSGAVWAFADVSEARQMAAALMDAAAWLRMLELHTFGVLLELDSDARIVGLWGHAQAFFEEADAALQGKTLVEVLGEEVGAALDARVRRVLCTGADEEHECSIDVRGSSRVARTHAAALVGGEGVARRVTLLIEDVTDRARMQTQLLQAERLASIGLLAAGVAHEINNPLAYVLLNLERIRQRVAGLDPQGEQAELRCAIEMSIEGAARVQAIVRDLNLFSRSESGRPLPVDVRGAIDFAIAMAEPAIGRHVTLVRELGPLPLVRASQTRLSQVFLNLLINAAHALAELEPEPAEIRVRTATSPGGDALIEVRDSGPGIPPAVLQHIFEPFYTTKTHGRGTGLGLAICQGVVAALGGRIEVESAEGAGATFRVTLPAAGEE